MNALPPSAVITSLFYACLVALVLSNAEASLIPRRSLNGALIGTAYQVRQSSSDVDRGRLTFEQCDQTTACEDPRSCKLISNKSVDCSEAEPCHCLPSEFIPCSAHEHCVEGELCAEVEEFGTVCASESFLNESSEAEKLPAEKPPPPPFPSEEGLTFDPCKPESCAIPRFCKTVADELRDCNGAVACHCVANQMTFCSASSDCIIGEGCASIPDRGDICVSESYAKHAMVAEFSPGSFGVPSPTPTPAADAEGGSAQSGIGNICIGAEFLTHLPRDALRFKEDRFAMVLCDEDGSCATPGHMVRYNEEAMMMISYCNYVRCKRRMMKVNSPRYKRGTTISSRTSGLMFTVFAARYGTLAEEKILKGVLRLGL